MATQQKSLFDTLKDHANNALSVAKGAMDKATKRVQGAVGTQTAAAAPAPRTVSTPVTSPVRPQYYPASTVGGKRRKSGKKTRGKKTRGKKSRGHKKKGRRTRRK